MMIDSYYDRIYQLVHDSYTDKVERDLLKGVDVKKEYELIQLKRSKLSSVMRKLVIIRYERSINLNYIKPH